MADSTSLTHNDFLAITREGQTYVITLHHRGDNPLDIRLLVAINEAFVELRGRITNSDYGTEGSCVVLTGSGSSYFSSGVPMDDEERVGNILRDAFAPLLLTVLTFPFPTVCLINGKCEGGACILSMCHDYRILSRETGRICFDAIRLGAHFVGIAAILRDKLSARAARKMALEGHNFSSEEALSYGLVDELPSAESQMRSALDLARRVAVLGAHGSYGLMRKELLGDTILKIINNCM